MLNIKFEDSTIPRYYGDGDAWFKEGLAMVKEKDEFYGFIDKTGKEVIPCVYKEAEDFSEGLSCVQNKDDLYGFINHKGEVVLPFIYEYATSFSEGYAFVGDGEWRGFIDKHGNKKITVDRVEVLEENFHDGMAIITCFEKKKEDIKECIKYVNKDGKFIGPFDTGSSFENGRATVIKDNKMYSIDKDGNILSKSLFLSKNSKISTEPNSPLTKIEYNMERFWSKFGFIDENGSIKYNGFKDAHDFSDGVAFIRTKKYEAAMINLDGEMTQLNAITEEGFSRGGFHEGLLVAGINCMDDDEKRKFGYVDKTLKVVIPLEYWEAFSFSEGLAKVVDHRYFIYYINHAGEKVITIPPLHKSIAYVNGVEEETLYAGSERELLLEKIHFLHKIKNDTDLLTEYYVEQMQEDVKTLQKKKIVTEGLC